MTRNAYLIVEPDGEVAIDHGSRAIQRAVNGAKAVYAIDATVEPPTLALTTLSVEKDVLATLETRALEVNGEKVEEGQVRVQAP